MNFLLNDDQNLLKVAIQEFARKEIEPCADHIDHAVSDFFGGGCYFNGAAFAIRQLRDRLDMIRFTIIDTDAHHSDSNWEMLQDDPDVLYICICNRAVNITKNLMRGVAIYKIIGIH